MFPYFITSKYVPTNNCTNNNKKMPSSQKKNNRKDASIFMQQDAPKSMPSHHVVWAVEIHTI
jgi:hypothetical protein